MAPRRITCAKIRWTYAGTKKSVNASPFTEMLLALLICFGDRKQAATQVKTAEMVKSQRAVGQLCYMWRVRHLWGNSGGFCLFVVNAKLILWQAVHPLSIHIIPITSPVSVWPKDKWYSTRTWLSRCSNHSIHLRANNLSCSECFIWLDLSCLISILAPCKANGP